MDRSVAKIAGETGTEYMPWTLLTLDWHSFVQERIVYDHDHHRASRDVGNVEDEFRARHMSLTP